MNEGGERKRGSLDNGCHAKKMKQHRGVGLLV